MLRAIAKEIEGALAPLPGIQDLVANREVMIDTLPIAFDREKLASHGLTPGEAGRQIETAFRGRTVGVVNEGGARYDIVVRLAEDARQDPEQVAQFLLRSPSGARVRVRTVLEQYFLEALHLARRGTLQS